MPIIGLTDNGPQWPKIGTLRKGAPKPNDRQPGSDLKDSFRFDTDNADAADAFRAAYGDKPNHIRVMLMFGTVEENFEAWKEHYSAGALKRRCDGQTCIQRLVNGAYDFTPQSCECALHGLQKPQACGPVGRLKVVIPELARMGYVLVGTTSIHDIIELQSNLEAAAALRGDLRGIPFILSRRPRKVSIPGGDDGKRRRMEKWLLSLEPAPDWVRLQIVAMQRAALPTSEVLALPAPQVDEETGEVFEEEPEPVIERKDGLLSNIDARYNGNGDFFFKATINGGDWATTILAKDELGIQLNDVPAGIPVIVWGTWTSSPKLGNYLSVLRFQQLGDTPATIVNEPELTPDEQRANGTRLDDLEADYDAIDKELAPVGAEDLL
jgi:hypothetical protein